MGGGNHPPKIFRRQKSIFEDIDMRFSTNFKFGLRRGIRLRTSVMCLISMLAARNERRVCMNVPVTLWIPRLHAHNPAAKHRQKSGCNQQHCSTPPCYASHLPPFGGFPWPPHGWMMPPPPPPPWMRGIPHPPPPWAMEPWSAGKPRR